MHALIDESVSGLTTKSEETKAESQKSDFELKTLPPDYLLMPEPGADGAIVRYGYQIGQLNFIIPDNAVSEIIQNAMVFNLPNSPKWIKGLTNVRGNIVPVINIHHVLGEVASENQKILVLGHSENLLALVIDSLPVSLADLDEKQTTETSNEAIQPYSDKVYHYNNQQWHEFDIQGFFKKLSKSS